MDLPEQVEIEMVQLERMKLCIEQRLTKELAYSFGEPPEVMLTPFLDAMTDDIAVRVVQSVWGRNLQRQEVRWPATWWEAVKERFLPAWAKERWPVRYRVVTLTARELWPLLSFPGRMGRGRVVTVAKTELLW